MHIHGNTFIISAIEKISDCDIIMSANLVKSAQSDLRLNAANAKAEGGSNDPPSAFLA